MCKDYKSTGIIYTTYKESDRSCNMAELKLPVNYNNLKSAERARVREKYIKRQNGCCWYCKEPLTGPPAEDVRRLNVTRYLFPPGFFRWPIHLHHDHNTGMTIGAVHAYCNAVLWQYHNE